MGLSLDSGYSRRKQVSLRSDLPPPPSPRWPARSTVELVARKPGDFARVPRAPISVVLDDVRSLANVGLIFRLCDALRVERLYLCGITGHPPRREIDKTAVMAVPYVPWEYRESALEVASELRAQGRQVVAVEQAHGSLPFDRPRIYQP